MKIIFKIARAELRSLFYSPVAWFVVFLLYITCVALFTLTMEGLITFQEVVVDLDPNYIGSPGIGKNIAETILSKLLQYLYLFIPLLTMGIVSREINTGTIKLLYSSPVTTREIVFGKYLGLVLFNMLLLLIFSIILVSIYMTVENVEYHWFFSILLGVFLLINAFGAIGLFISCLTTYQIVAAMITFTVFFILSVISSLWQQYDLIRDITWFLSMAGKAGLMMNGLITSRDVIYFLLIIILFIGFALIKMKGTQEPRKWTVTAFQYIALFLMVITLGYFSSRPGYIAYADLTKSKINTIHPATLEIVKELDGSPLTVTLYTNLFDRQARMGLPQYRNMYLSNIWEPFIRFYPQLIFKYEYYYDLRKGDSSLFRKYPGKTLEEIRDIEAEIMGIRPSIFKTPEEIRKLIDLEPEGKRLIMQLEYKGKKEFLRTYDDTPVWPEQQHFAAVFKRLARKKDVQIHFVNGHYERDVHDYGFRNFGYHLTYKLGRHAMLNLGVDSDTISLSAAPVPTHTELLVVADPRSAYSETEQGRIRDYIKKGGNAIFFAEPGKQIMLDSVLKTMGVYLENGIIVQLDKHEVPILFKNSLTKAGNFLAKEKDMEYFQQFGSRGATLQNEGALHLNYQEIDGFKIEPVIAMPANEKTWIENGELVIDSAAPVYSVAEGDVRKSGYLLAVKLTRKMGNREQRILVCGDADILNARRFASNDSKLAFYSWGLENKYPIYNNYPFPLDRFISITNTQAKLMTVIYLYIGGSLLLLSAIVLLVRRKRK